ncbi:hypothetical protein KP509_15G077700 [Ceratopteris richardii]|nr:hypothetical protein KP509_15G077700 [Ceratopteris richardii]KAH7405610.1 hypothetical protein KP509_15G077700 [Ceratopteris richardii]KAH7405611.1 hypothetical protein KP509_15G077700 [Ceratopteris richardii]KAH7405612.1 hypothetical protein KP509_15G077700 [Ceratopteris richardii]
MRETAPILEKPDEVMSGTRKTVPKLSLFPLVFLIFYEVSGGPFGIEDSVKAGGPLLAILGFLVFPLIWSIPEALITAELGTMFPENGGYVIWITEAFGPFWGFQQGWWKWLSGVIDNGLYPVLFLDYLKAVVPAVAEGPVRVVSILAITAALTYLNYRGLSIVGWLAVAVGVFSLLPFGVMAILAVPRLDFARWLVIDLEKVDWTTYLNTLFWNLNYWDSVSTLAGEVQSPHISLPKALLYAVLLVICSYLVPLLAGLGATELVRDDWSDGHFANIAVALGGAWLGWWMEASAAVSNMGMFVAEMSSDSFQLLGMAEQGMLPRFFARRSVHGTPTLAIFASATGVLLLSSLTFKEIIAAENYLYCFGMIAEFAAFLWLRLRRGDIPRPYKLPLGLIGSTIMCIPPTILIVSVMVLATFKVAILSCIAVLFGFGLYPCLGLMKKNFVSFAVDAEFVKAKDNKTGISKDLVDSQVSLLRETA